MALGVSPGCHPWRGGGVRRGCHPGEVALSPGGCVLVGPLTLCPRSWAPGLLWKSRTWSPKASSSTKRSEHTEGGWGVLPPRGVLSPLAPHLLPPPPSLCCLPNKLFSPGFALACCSGGAQWGAGGGPAPPSTPSVLRPPRAPSQRYRIRGRRRFKKSGRGGPFKSGGGGGTTPLGLHGDAEASGGGRGQRSAQAQCGA